MPRKPATQKTVLKRQPKGARPKRKLTITVDQDIADRFEDRAEYLGKSMSWMIADIMETTGQNVLDLGDRKIAAGYVEGDFGVGDTANENVGSVGMILQEIRGQDLKLLIEITSTLADQIREQREEIRGLYRELEKEKTEINKLRDELGAKLDSRITRATEIENKKLYNRMVQLLNQFQGNLLGENEDENSGGSVQKPSQVDKESAGLPPIEKDAAAPAASQEDKIKALRRSISDAIAAAFPSEDAHALADAADQVWDHIMSLPQDERAATIKKAMNPDPRGDLQDYLFDLGWQVVPGRTM